MELNYCVEDLQCFLLLKRNYSLMKILVYRRQFIEKKMVNINPTLGFEEPLDPLFPNGSKASSLVLSDPPKEAKGSTLPKGSPCQEWV